MSPSGQTSVDRSIRLKRATARTIYLRPSQLRSGRRKIPLQGGAPGCDEEAGYSAKGCVGRWRGKNSRYFRRRSAFMIRLSPCQARPPRCGHGDRTRICSPRELHTSSLTRKSSPQLLLIPRRHCGARSVQVNHSSLSLAHARKSLISRNPARSQRNQNQSRRNNPRPTDRRWIPLKRHYGSSTLDAKTKRRCLIAGEGNLRPKRQKRKRPMSLSEPRQKPRSIPPAALTLRQEARHRSARLPARSGFRLSA